ncbi:MAG: site-2 protease family protein [Bryobacterales bacterium]|nr:site-2 protease family protein [Bryobacterales bacterium]
MFDSEMIVSGLMWYVAFLFSTVCHEAAHAWAALRGGDTTAYHGGQVSLDPLPHIQREPFGMIIMPWLSFLLNGGSFMMGWASAPYDPNWARYYPKRAAWMSLAGPAANFLLAILAGLAIRFGLASGALLASERMLTNSGDAVLQLLSITFFLNIVLGTFNLLPLPPLDGFTAIGILLPEATAARLEEFRQTAGMFQMVGLLVAWQVAGYFIWPVYHFASTVIIGR